MNDQPNPSKGGGNPQTEGMGVGLTVLLVIAAMCGLVIWAAVYL